jgi:outer membrane protein assembly factor BamD
MKIRCQALLSGVLFVVLMSCSSGTKTTGKTEAEVLFKQAKDYFDEERYLLATEKLNALRSQHPYSYFSTHAELMMADIFFKQENFVEAATAYLTFKDLHPKHEKMAYVFWMLGESFFYQLPTSHDRDLSAATDALKYYEETIRLYPQSGYEEEATKRMKIIKEMLRKKDLYAADFYFKTEVFGSASSRYFQILEKYQDQDTQVYALEKLMKSIVHLSQQKCLEFYGKLEKEHSSSMSSKYLSVRDECQKQPLEETF